MSDCNVRHTLAIAIFAAMTCAPRAHAAVETTYDNDTNAMVPGAATTDRNYTFGVHGAWWGEPGVTPRWTDRLAHRLDGGDPASVRRVSLVAGQELYTPDALSNPRPILNDRPYAAWLFAGATLSSANAAHARAIELRLGMVGPAAQGQAVQSWWHRREHIRLPRGWSHQLANEPGVALTLDERWRPCGLQRHLDIVPHVRLTAGNVSTAAAAGATLRVGLPLPNDFGPGAPSGPAAVTRGWRAYAFARGEGRAIARDLFLDGNTFAASQSVHREPFVAEGQMGLGLTRGTFAVRWQFSYTTRQFRERPYAQEYGSVGVAF